MPSMQLRRVFVVFCFFIASSAFAAQKQQSGTASLPDFDAAGGLRIGAPASAKAPASGLRVTTESASRATVRTTINLQTRTPRTLWSSAPLTAASDDPPREVARRFLRANSAMWRISEPDRAFELSAEVPDAHTGATHVYMNQMIDGVRVFPAVIGVHLNSQRQVMAVHGDVFPLDLRWTAKLTSAQAARAAAKFAGVAFEPRLRRQIEDAAVIEPGPFRSEITVTRTIYAMMNPPRPAYRMLLEKNGTEWYDIIVDAETGQLLHRRNLYQFAGILTPSAPVEANPAAPRGLVYNEHPLATVRGTGDLQRDYLYTCDPTGMQRGFANSPLYGADASPVNANGGDSLNATINQTLLALPNAASPLRSSSLPLSTSPQSPQGWFTPVGGTYFTIGNNVDAKDDRAADNEATVGFRPNGGATGDFTGDSFVYRNFYGQLGAAGAANDLPAAVMTLFHVNNWYHDLLYHLGFTEAAGNFQKDNFGKGGIGNDHVLADAQDGSGTNNANFGTPPDGSNPRMQMFLWTGPNRDGTLDGDIIIHEYSHGLSNRLVGGPNNVDCLGAGLTGEAGGMGEGWGDWFAATIYDEPAVAEYAVADGENGLRLHAYNSYSEQYTYGLLCTGDPMDPNPTGCEVHGAGEFWAMLLWETREAMINRYHNFSSPLKFPTYLAKGVGGNIRNALGRTFDGSGSAAQTDHAAIENAAFAAMFRVVDAMKLSPCGPTMVDMRDAILQGDRTMGGEFQDVIWRSFANRGLGAGAASLGGGDVPATVEDFSVPATVAACEDAGGPLPAPQFTVTVGTNSATITITPLAGAAEYVIERGAAGAGSAVDPKPFVEVARGTGTTFTDTNLNGGQTFWYRVRALRNEECVSTANVLSAVPSGGATECTVPPSFGGVANVLDAGNCSEIRLDWQTATSSCPSAQTVTYAIYRSTDSNFTPSASNLIAAGVVGNSYVDVPPAQDTLHYYIVRAEDSTSGHGGPNNGGNTDANLVRRSAMTTSGLLVNEGFRDDVESGTDGAHSTQFTSSSPVIVIPERGGWFRDSDSSPVPPHSGSTVWHTFNADNQPVSPSDSLVFELRSNPLTITPQSILTFFHTFASEAGFDGGVVEWAPVLAGGVAGSFSDLGSLIYENGYNGTMSSTAFGLLNTNPLANRSGYTGGDLGTLRRVRAHVGALVPSGTTSRAIVLRFLFGNDVAQSGDPSVPGDFLPGWYIDDISVDHSCCPASAAPRHLKAKNTKEGFIRLDWQAPQGGGAIEKYLIYRETDAGAVPSTFDEQIAEVPGSTRQYIDSSVRFGTTYHYVVRAIPVGSCPSDPSNVATRAAKVPCTDAPSFAGAESVSSPASSSCTLVVSWDAATASCPEASVSYNVYRSADPAFVPSPSTLIAKALMSTSYSDSNGLVSGTTYYYIVRAEDSTDNGTGPANSGNEDTNTNRVSGTPAGPLMAGPDFSDDMEPAAESGYSTSSTRTVGGWQVLSDLTAHSASHAWVVLDDQPGVPELTPNDAFLDLPVMNLTSSSVLTFWHNYDFARFPLSTPATRYQSGAVLEISADGIQWYDLGAFITSGGYNGIVDNDPASPSQSSLRGRNAWVGSSDGDNIAGRADAMKPVAVNIGGAIANLFGGATSLPGVRVRFRLGGTFQALIGGIQGTGWGVDDITMTGLLAPGACSTGQ